MRTLGSEALKGRMSEHGSMTQLAKELGVYPNMVSRWASGERTPRLPMLKRIEESTGIQVALWTEPAPASEPEAPTGTEG